MQPRLGLIKRGRVMGKSVASGDANLCDISGAWGGTISTVGGSVSAVRGTTSTVGGTRKLPRWPRKSRKLLTQGARGSSQRVVKWGSWTRGLAK